MKNRIWFPVVLLLVGVLTLQIPEHASACSCLPAANELTLEEVKGYDLIAKGRITKLELVFSDDGEEVIAATLEVSKSWKGDKATGDLVVLLTGKDSGACGYPFEQGGEYLVFRTAGYSRVGLCERTTPLKKAQALIRQLNVLLD